VPSPLAGEGTLDLVHFFVFKSISYGVVE
jgi:hypothetical protein